MSTMSKLIRGLVAASALAICLPAQALVTVAGITWDPDAVGDFTMDGGSAFQFTKKGFEAADANGTFMNTAQALATPLAPNAPNTVYQNGGANPGVIEGFAVITQINGALFGVDVPGRQLTAIFGGMDIYANGASPFGSNIGGAPWIRLYSDATTTAVGTNPATVGNAANGTLWLSMVLAPTNSIGFSYVGPNTINPDSGGARQFAIQGEFVITGGAAAGNFEPGPFNFDLGFGSSTSNYEPFFTTGSVALSGISVPEPGSLALIGLALIGAGFAGRRKVAA